ncbi:PAS domain-containing sensor histidine kinase [Phaeocystidibacter luteus]|uniref:histidine kinase n=1 Tax=Phaeocystidibacter luteus TaxID=911197 RepID=A0A6N6RKE3_9FLAO|nr:PAS domain S-box protein [Phaeocystidibacter luteus]KAB2805423.1 PAS domain S-box protein [Phaeocystidibacter luteus]
MNYLHEELTQLLKEDEGIFQFIQESALDGLWYWDLSSPEDEWMSENFWTTLGYDPSTKPHKASAWQDLINPDDGESALKLAQQHFADPSVPYDQVVRYKHANGSTVWIRCRGMAIRDEKGAPIRMLGAHTDITEQKEQELKLDRELQWFTNILESSSIATWRLRLDTGEVHVNSVWEKSFGLYIPEDGVINISDWKALVHEEDVALFDDCIASFKEGKSTTVELRFEINGDIHWIKSQGEPYFEQGEDWVLGICLDVSLEKSKEIESQQSNELYYAFISHAPSAIAMFDNDMHYIAASDQWMRDYGLVGRNIIGQSHYDVFPEIGDDWKEIHKKCLNGHIDKVDEAPFERADGALQWLRWEVGPWRRGGVIGGLIMYTEDITKRKNEEALLLQYKNLLESSNKVARIGTWEVNLEDMTSTWSDTTKEIHGVPSDYQSNVETGINFYKEGESRDRITEVFNAAVSKGERFDEELIIVDAKGEERWIRTVGIPEMAEGQCVRVYGIFQDIDKRKRAAEVLAAQEELFRNTFEYASIGMALVGLDGTWMRVNKRVAEFLGYSQEELLELTFQEITHVEDLGSDLELLGQLVDGKIEHYQLEKRYIHKDGHLVWGLLAVSLVKNEEGEPLHFISQITDITAQKELLNVTSNQNERLMNFAHIVSHNLRSHSGNLSMLLDLFVQDEPAFVDSPYYSMFKSASENLSETIANLNEVVSMQTTSQEALQSKELYGFVVSALKNVEGLLTDVTAEVDVQIDKSLEVLVIPAYLDSILNNLITNAIKYRSKERRLKLTFSVTTGDEDVRLAVADNGLGIDLELHGHKMFGMYKTFHKNPEARGIGLFISKNQIETMGGDIDVESEVGKGTTFTLTLKR